MRRFAAAAVALSVGVLRWRWRLLPPDRGRGAPGGAARARDRRRPGRRRRGSADPRRSASSSGRGARPTASWTARRGARSERADGRCSVSASSGGAVGWDVAVLEFRLRRYGLSRGRVDGRFTARQRGAATIPAAHGHSTPTGSPGRTRPALSPGVRRAGPHRRARGRASSRSPQRYHVSPGGSRARTGSR